MIRVNIHQLRKIVQHELGRPLRESEGDITIDVVSDFLADRLKTQLFANAPSSIRKFLESPLAKSAFYPSDDGQVQQMTNQISQQVMTRMGSSMQQYVRSVVQGILKGAAEGAVQEAFGSANVSSEECGCEAPEAEPQGMFAGEVEIIAIDEFPDDFNKCDECGFDHEYEWSKAQAWHEAHDLE